jgi:hypothetical protein
MNADTEKPSVYVTNTDLMLDMKAATSIFAPVELMRPDLRIDPDFPRSVSATFPCSSSDSIWLLRPRCGVQQAIDITMQCAV